MDMEIKRKTKFLRKIIQLANSFFDCINYTESLYYIPIHDTSAVRDRISTVQRIYYPSTRAYHIQLDYII